MRIASGRSAAGMTNIYANKNIPVFDSTIRYSQVLVPFYNYELAISCMQSQNGPATGEIIIIIFRILLPQSLHRQFNSDLQCQPLRLIIQFFYCLASNHKMLILVLCLNIYFNSYQRTILTKAQIVIKGTQLYLITMFKFSYIYLSLLNI